MANIIPFKGYRYNTDKIDNMGLVVCPPYDSITEDEQNYLYDLHDNNAVRLLLGKTFGSDTETDNRYTRSAEYFREWVEKEVLVQDNEESIYVYEQVITLNDNQLSSKGFISLLELEEFRNGGIMPCEETIPSSKMDRYNLLKATGANISMITCMYIETERYLVNAMNKISEKEPDMSFVTEDGVEQNLWRITDNDTIEIIKKYMQDKALYITDGQNRYETCLEYKKMMQKNNPDHTGRESYNYIMACFINADRNGMFLLPVHRLVSMKKGFKEDYVVSCAQDHFKVEKIIVDTTMEELAETMRRQIATPRKENRIAFYCGGDYFYRFTFRDMNYLDQILADKSEAYRSLDVTVLNELILREILNITAEKYHECVTFTKRIGHGIDAVKNGEYNCMFVINPTKPSQISQVAAASEKMPERSICIFPKPATGIVIHKHDRS